jgi:hypothetical protein
MLVKGVYAFNFTNPNLQGIETKGIWSNLKAYVINIG